MITWIAAAASLLALIPGVLFLRNLPLYAPLPQPGSDPDPVSILIPARNEEANIGGAVRSALQSHGIELEIVVLDDGSHDRTAEIVRDLAANDSRVRLETAGPLPAGWCGKNFACYQLASFAKHPLLVFMDADVRITRPDSLARLATFVAQTGAALVSGVPSQKTGGFMEKLIIPLIHFVLLGFLPIARMRTSTDPRFAAACGQVLAARRDAYVSTGGHSAIPNRIHDAVALTRSFRSLGFGSDLFDATDTFCCRMYDHPAAVWHGFAKNAHEGLGSPALIVPATVLLLGGQVLPVVLLAFADTPLALGLAVVGTVAMYVPRLISVLRFGQSPLGALLHPFGICALVSIQWSAFLRARRRQPAVWKGRSYLPAAVPHP